MLSIERISTPVAHVAVVDEEAAQDMQRVSEQLRRWRDRLGEIDAAARHGDALTPVRIAADIVRDRHDLAGALYEAVYWLDWARGTQE